jgi:hypothetical protein
MDTSTGDIGVIHQTTDNVPSLGGMDHHFTSFRWCLILDTDHESLEYQVDSVELIDV